MSYRDDDLDGLLAMARLRDVQPTDSLMARVMVDAAAVQAQRLASVPVPVAAGVSRAGFWSSGFWSRGFWSGLAGALGGGGAVAGMSAATVAGVFLGVMQPAPVAALTQALLTGTPLEQMDLLPGADALWAEE